MKHITQAISGFALASVLLVAFNNCNGFKENSINIPNQLDKGGTETGNGLNATAVVARACAVIVSGHPELNNADCMSGVSKTTLSPSLGVPPKTLDPFRSLIAAESAGAIHANANALSNCIANIDAIDPHSPQVQAAYNTSNFNPFSEMAKMIPTQANGCPAAYSDNSFVVPTPTPAPPGAVVMDFDNPQPPNNVYGLIPGIFGDINFGNNQDWHWQAPYDADSSNSIFPNTSFPASFSFATGAKNLISIRFFSDQAGTVTVSDENGQSASMLIPADSQMHTLFLNFAQPSNIVTIDFPFIWKMALDDITYKTPVNASAIHMVQNAEVFYDTNSASLAFDSANTTGNTIIVVTDWDPGYTLKSLSDTQLNTYLPVTAETSGLGYGGSPGLKYQIWYASNIKGGANTIKTQLQGTPIFPGLYRLYIYEYAGLDPINPVDVVGTQFGSSAIINSATIITHFANELIFAYFSLTEASVIADSGYTVRTNRPPEGVTQFIEDKTVNQIGSFKATASIPTGDSPWFTQIIGFKGK